MAPATRVARQLPVAILIAFSLILVGGSGSALAVPAGHTYGFSFGEYGTQAGQFRVEYSGFGMDIDRSTGDIYVADTSNYRIQKFDEDGNFILTWGYGVKDGANELQVCEAPETCQEGLYGNAPGQMQVPMSVAVDNSGGPNDGDVYVVDSNTPCCAPGAGRNLILKYSEDGHYLGMIDGAGSPSGVFNELGWRRMAAVDDSGFLWVLAGSGFGSQEARVMKFSNQISNSYVGGSEWTPTIAPYGNPESAWTWELTIAPDGSYVYLPEFQSLYRFVANGSAYREVMPLEDEWGYYADMALDPNSEHLIVSRGNRIQEYIDNATGPETVGPEFGSEQLSDVAGLTVNGDSGYVYAGDEYQAKVFVFKPRRVPEVNTGGASNVLHTTATINGQTAPDPIDGGPVSECRFEWGLTTTYEHVTDCVESPPFAGPTDVHLDLSGLQQEGTYHYRLVATNSIGTEFGKDQTFTPHAVLGLSTDEASGITAHSATLNGSLEPAGEATEYFFEWGRQAVNLNHTTALDTSGAGPGQATVAAAIEGLEDYTEYHFRLRATNSIGTSYGQVQAFRTKAADAPTISNIETDQVTAEGAHFSAIVAPNWGETIYGFEYGESPAYGSQVLGEGILAADGLGHQVGLAVSGLTPGRGYHYRAIAINFGGISYGPDRTFTTLDVPEVVSEAATGVGSSGARLNALVAPGLSSTTVRFEYGASPGYGSTTPGVGIGAGSSPVPASVDVGGLAPDTRYHFRAVATNEIGTELGPDQTFKTGAAQIESTPPPPPRCKKGQVRRHGKCVRRKHRRRHKHQKRRRHHRNASRGNHRGVR